MLHWWVQEGWWDHLLRLGLAEGLQSPVLEVKSSLKVAALTGGHEWIGLRLLMLLETCRYQVPWSEGRAAQDSARQCFSFAKYSKKLAYLLLSQV